MRQHNHAFLHGAYYLLLLTLLISCSSPAPTSPPFLTTEVSLPTTATAMGAVTQAAASVGTPTALSQGPPLVFFTSEPGKFQVWLPVSESIQNFTLTKTLFGKSIECPVINFRLNGAYAVVQYCDLDPESITSLSDDELLDQVRREIIRGIDTKLDTPQRVVVQGIYPALTLSGQADMRGMGYDGTFKARIILADNRIYLVAMSVYLENWCNCLHQIDQVVDSLYIEPDLSIPFEPTP